MKLIDRYLSTPRGVRSVIPGVVRHIVARGKGYKTKIGDAWYEVIVYTCEPPESDEPLQDAIM